MRHCALCSKEFAEVKEDWCHWLALGQSVNRVADVLMSHGFRCHRLQTQSDKWTDPRSRIIHVPMCEACLRDIADMPTRTYTDYMGNCRQLVDPGGYSHQCDVRDLLSAQAKLLLNRMDIARTNRCRYRVQHPDILSLAQTSSATLCHVSPSSNSGDSVHIEAPPLVLQTTVISKPSLPGRLATVSEAGEPAEL